MKKKVQRPQRRSFCRNGLFIFVILAVQGIAGYFVVTNLLTSNDNAPNRKASVLHSLGTQNGNRSKILGVHAGVATVEEGSKQGQPQTAITQRRNHGQAVVAGSHGPVEATPQLSFRQREREYRARLGGHLDQRGKSPALSGAMMNHSGVQPDAMSDGLHLAEARVLAPKKGSDGDSPGSLNSKMHPQALPQDHTTIAKGLHIFYYAWYASPKIDGKWSHWNHKFLPHWTKEVNNRYRQIGTSHTPPEDIGANYYPEIGPYSSSDPEVIRTHVRQIANAGIGVLVYSWWGRGKGDANGDPTDERIIDMVMLECVRNGIKIAFHVEPYEGRTADSVIVDTKYLIDKYGDHEAFHRSVNHHNRTMLYLYDSYHIKPDQWRRAFRTVRGTKYDSVFLGLWVEHQHGQDIKNGGFDGFYTYFAARGFTYGSKYENWVSMQQFALQNRLLFVPSFGPGYIDTAVRPWNGENIRNRRGGGYFKEAWASARRVKPQVLSLTSFNEWHEGTQLEPASVQKNGRYLDYEEHKGTYYLDLVKDQVEDCRQRYSAPEWCFS